MSEAAALKPKICIVALYTYPLFNRDVRTPFGGSEVRVATLARGLARRGNFEVSLVVFDDGQPHVEEREGIRIYSRTGERPPGDPRNVPNPLDRPWYSRDRLPLYKKGGLRDRALWAALALAHRTRRAVVKRLRKPPPGPPIAGKVGPYPILERWMQLYDEIGADIYVVPGNNLLGAEVAFYCSARKKKYVFLAGSDADYHPSFKLEPFAKGIYGIEGRALVYAVENAAQHVVQTEHQAELLRAQYGRSALVLPNPMSLERKYPRSREPRTVLWVGKSDWIKRPERVLELAERLPDHRFRMIMNVSSPDIHARVVSRARGLANVELAEYVPFEEIERWFATAAILLNTSVLEGFPNTFLQAGKYAVPIVSSNVDPGGMLGQEGAGFVSGESIEAAAACIARLSADEALYAATAAKCLEYVRARHDEARVAEQLEQALSALLGP